MERLLGQVLLCGTRVTLDCLLCDTCVMHDSLQCDTCVALNGGALVSRRAAVVRPGATVGHTCNT
eukprot:9470327-Pyramimonas_sp.AAC.1